MAIKKLHRPFQSEIFAKRAYRELRLLKHMKHENVSRFNPAQLLLPLTDCSFDKHFWPLKYIIILSFRYENICWKYFSSSRLLPPLWMCHLAFSFQLGDRTSWCVYTCLGPRWHPGLVSIFHHLSKALGQRQVATLMICRISFYLQKCLHGCRTFGNKDRFLFWGLNNRSVSRVMGECFFSLLTFCDCLTGLLTVVKPSCLNNI